MRFSEIHLDAMHEPAETSSVTCSAPDTPLRARTCKHACGRCWSWGTPTPKVRWPSPPATSPNWLASCALYGDMAGAMHRLGTLEDGRHAMADVFNARARAQGRDEPVNASTMTKPLG